MSVDVDFEKAHCAMIAELVACARMDEPSYFLHVVDWMQERLWCDYPPITQQRAIALAALNNEQNRSTT